MEDAKMASKVLELAIRERKLALSQREWRHRLAGFGYAIRDTEEGAMIESLRNRNAICAVPADLMV